MNRLYGTAIPGLESAMRFRLVRQGVLATNVTNSDTPNYRRTDVSFDSELAKADASLQGGHERHITSSHASYEVTRGPKGTRPDGNGVDRDQEVIHMVRNAGAFQDAASVLARIYTMRRMAVTGELS